MSSIAKLDYKTKNLDFLSKKTRLSSYRTNSMPYTPADQTAEPLQWRHDERDSISNH